MINFVIQLAGIALLFICLANALAFQKLGWNRNLVKTETFFTQVFKVHVTYLVFTMAAMAGACLFATKELLLNDNLMTSGFLWFTALFWGIRVVLHLFYYDREMKQKHPYWNLLFFLTFLFLAILFFTLALH